VVARHSRLYFERRGGANSKVLVCVLDADGDVKCVTSSDGVSFERREALSIVDEAEVGCERFGNAEGDVHGHVCSGYAGDVLGYHVFGCGYGASALAGGVC
jgi:hypothetical protein